MIVAADKNWCIGNRGGLLDKFPEDMKFFKSVTNHRVVVMGRNTQESLPKKYLPHRINIILNNTDTPDAISESDIQEEDTRVWCIKHAEMIPLSIDLFNASHAMSDPGKFDYIIDSDVFICGGGQIYRYFLENDLIDTIYLTHIEHEYDGDTFIPNLYELGFKEVKQLFPIFENANGVKYSFKILKK
jgi:dihydrofolate reductase